MPSSMVVGTRHDEHLEARLRERARVCGLEGHVEAALALVPDREPSTDDLDAIVIVAGCLAGDRRAQACFAERYFRRVRPALKSIGLDDASTDDIQQRVWVKLFVGGGTEQPAIVEYLGKGDLAAFVKVVATRLALSERRRDKPRAGDEALVHLPDRTASPQFAYLNASEGALLRSTVEEAAKALSAEQRVLLRLCYVDGLTVDEIGATYNVHRATAARRVARARALLILNVRKLLKNRLNVDSSELDSVMRDVQSALHVSISRILSP